MTDGAANTVDLEFEQAADLIELYTRLGKHADARKALNKLLPAVGSDVPEFQEPDQISFDAAMAFICAKIERLEKGVEYARLALLKNPTDTLAHVLLGDDAKIRVARSLIHHERATEAWTVFQIMRHSSLAAEAIYTLSLLDYFDSERESIRSLAPHEVGAGHRRPLLLNVIVWGAAYVDQIFQYMIPSLLAPGNIPKVCQDRDIIFDFYTCAEDRDRIENHPLAHKMKQFATLQYNIIPDSLLYEDADKTVSVADRWIAGGAQQCSALRAHRIGADMSYLGISGVYSANCFSNGMGYIDSGNLAVLTCPPRAIEPETHARLKDYGTISKGVIDIDEQALVQFVVDNMHPHCRNSFIAADTTVIKQDPVALYFRTPTGYACRTFQTSPFILSHDLLSDSFAFDYATTDMRFAADLIGDRSPEGLVKIVSDPANELVVVDIDVETGPAMKQYFDIPVTAEVSVTSALSSALKETDIGYYQWALQQRFVYNAENNLDRLPAPGLDEDETVNRMVTLLEQERANVALKIRAYRNQLPA